MIVTGFKTVGMQIFDAKAMLENIISQYDLTKVDVIVKLDVKIKEGKK